MPFRLPLRLCNDAIANYFILTGTCNARVASPIPQRDNAFIFITAFIPELFMLDFISAAETRSVCGWELSPAEQGEPECSNKDV